MRKITLTSIGDRLRKYLKHKGLGVNEFGTLMGTSGSQVSNILRGKNYGANKLIGVIEYSEDLNLEWLIKGEGEMIKQDKNPSDKRESKNNTSADDNLLKENAILKQEIKNLKPRIEYFEGTSAYKDMTIEAYKTTIEVLLSSNKDLKEFIEHLKASEKEGGASKKKTA